MSDKRKYFYYSLDQVREFAVRLEEERKTEIRAVRRAALVIYQPDAAQQSPGFDLAALSDEQWTSLLEGARLRHEQQQEAIRLAEERRQAEAAAEALRRAEEVKAQEAERQRMIAENTRLEKERKEQEEARRVEREEATRVQRETEAKAAKERAELMAKQREEQAVAAQKAALERAKMDAENARLRTIAEGAARELATREKEAAEKLEAERKAALEKERAEAKARRAPDRAKIIAYAQALLAVPAPELVTPIAQDLGEKIATQLQRLDKWIKEEAGKL